MTTCTIPRITFETRSEPQPKAGYLGQVFVDGVNVLACGGTYGKTAMLASNDAGYTFVERTTPTTSGLRRMSRIDGVLALCGEYGSLTLSDDVGLTWTPIPIPTQQCLFQLATDHEGHRWLVGDGGFVARAPRGTWDFSVVDAGTKTRLLGVVRIDDRLLLLGFDGHVYERQGETFAPLPFSFGKAVTAIAVTSTGAWIVTCDGGAIFRSEDAGKTFVHVAAAGHDLESAHADERGVFVVGASGTLLFSPDDGKSFASVPTESSLHLWSIVRVGNGYLVSGDQRAIYAVVVSPTETITTAALAPPPPPAADAKEEDAVGSNDDDSDEDSDENEPGGAGASFASVEDASARWIKEGTAFMSGLNGYVDRIYSVGINKAGQEPSETRGDMADYVRAQLVAMNAAGEHRRARQLFPPAYEPFNYNALGRSVKQLAVIDDERTLVQVEGDVHVVERDRITSIDGATFFARSGDRRLVGIGFPDRIDIHEGFGGKKLRSLSLKAGDLGDLGARTTSGQLTPDGDGCLLTTDVGIFWLGERGHRVLMPEDGERTPSYLHGALSPNGRFVAVGCQDSSHILIDRKVGSRQTFGTVSSYPHFAYFHETRPEVLFNSVHALYGSGTLAVSLDALASGKAEPARTFDRRSWLFSAASYGDGYLFGDRGGYVWCLDETGKQKWYLFVGSSLTSLDVSRDQKTLFIGSIAGYVIRIDLTATARDPMLLTSGNVREAARWVFWRGHDPMIW